MPGLFNRSMPSKDVARDRLKMILVTDRVDGTMKMLEMMKNEIVKVLQQFLTISADDIELEICPPHETEDGAHITPPRLKADIPFKNMKIRNRN